MNKNKKVELLSGLSVDKLNEKMIFLKKELFNLRFQKTLGELTDTSAFSKVRKNVARVKTELSLKKNVQGGK